MPNVLRTGLEYVVKFCDEKLSGDPTYFDGSVYFDSANLQTAVDNVADMLHQIGTEGKAEELSGFHVKVCEWESEIASATDLDKETGPALESWRRCVTILRDFARRLAISPEVVAAEGQSFSKIGAITTDPEVPAVSKVGDLQPTLHSPDFRSVRWYGTCYSFTANQASVVGTLWASWEQGTPDVGDETLLKAADHEAPPRSLRDVFRDHPAWGTMIVSAGSKGSHRLTEPEKSL
ncbi:MAG: hypothetical protein L0Z53_17375 [Acidobacteriales bacterium]|nr:hypothetical protein [Terriglobales bacterium]